MANRRAHARVPLAPGTLEITMQGRRGDVTGQVVNASAGGMRAQFPRRPLPVAAVGVDVKLTLRGQALDTPLHATARVVHRHEQDDGVYFGLQLIDPPSIETGLPPDLIPVFNRRAVTRTGSPPQVEVKLSTYGSDGHHTASAQALDLSQLGIAVQVDPATEWMFASTRYVTASILLHPDQPSSLAVECRIRHRTLTDGGVHYGLEFVPKRTDQFHIKQNTIARFLETLNGKVG